MNGRIRTACLGLAGAFLTGIVLSQAGCDVKPGPLRTADGRVLRSLTVAQNDPAEVELVAAFQDAGAHYEQAVKVLYAFYVNTGALVKQDWASSELKNLQEALYFRFEGLPKPAPAPQSLEGPNEAGLVEQVVAARKGWIDKLERLSAYYQEKGLSFKSKAVIRVEERFDPVRTYAYFTNAEVPPATLRPTEVIADADALFARAFQLYKQGKPLPAITDYPKERRALLMFLQLVNQYPTSTKIAESAYCIAEIYKEYFVEDARAVLWYERSWQWDEHIQHPARSQAAFLYDLRLYQPGRALALYHQVLKYEQYAPDRIRAANQRIKELSAKKD